MIRYTREELNNLFSSLTPSIDIEYGEVNDEITYGTWVTTQGYSMFISVNLLRSLIFGSHRFVNVCVTLQSKAIYNLIYNTPLNKVALHINTEPDIAKWRLEVGK